MPGEFQLQDNNPLPQAPLSWALMMGYDASGDNWDRVRTDGSGRLQVVLAAGSSSIGTGDTELPAAAAVSADAQAAPTAPAVYGHGLLFNGATWDRARCDTSGRQIMVGPAAPGAAVSGNPLLMGGSDGTNARSLKTDDSGDLLVAGAVLQTNLNFNSPNSAATTVGATITGIGQYRSLLIYAEIRGGTGGTLDIYLQVSPDGGTTWIDYAHFPQLADGAAVIRRMWAVSKAGQQTTLQTVGTDTSPALAANTIIGGDWGDRMRVLAVAGAGTSAGAAQVLRLSFTS